MKSLDKGKEKLDKICKVLREETLEPAKEEARRIVAEAEKEAEQIRKAAEKAAEELIQKARDKGQQERNVIETSLRQAGKQALEALRQDVEGKLFNTELNHLVKEGAKDSQLVAKLIASIVSALEKEGSRADLTALVPASVPAKEVNAFLGDAVVSRLREGGVAVGNFSGGAQVRLNAEKMTIDVSDQALKELLSQYVRKDFRKLLFG